MHDLTLSILCYTYVHDTKVILQTTSLNVFRFLFVLVEHHNRYTLTK